MTDQKRWSVSSFSAFSLKPELLGSYSTVFFETADKMTAIRKAGLEAYIIEVMNSEEKVLLSFENTHFFDIFLAGHPILFSELCGKARVTHMAFISNVADPDIVLQMRVDVFSDVLYAVCHVGLSRTFVDIQPFIYPEPD